MTASPNLNFRASLLPAAEDAEEVDKEVDELLDAVLA